MLSHFKPQTVSALDDIILLTKVNQELLVDVRKLERSSTGNNIGKVEKAKMM